jgi:hypothetical protein
MSFDCSAYMGKSFIWNGDGTVGYDCVSLCVSILEKVKGREFLYPEKFFHDPQELNPDTNTLMERVLGRMSPVKVEVINKPTKEELVLGDIFMYRCMRMPFHVGVYVGNEKILSCVEGQGVIMISLHDQSWCRRINGVFRWL